MKQLVELADRIGHYNLIGKRKLAMIKLAIVQTQQHQDSLTEILAELDCHEVESLAQMFGIGGYQCYRSERVIHLEVYLLDNIYGEEAIEDQQFIKRKKIFESLHSNPEVYFLYLDPKTIAETIIDDRIEILALKRLDPTVCRDITWKNSPLQLYRDMVKTWEAVNRFNIITCLQDTKDTIKHLRKDE